jgi:AAA+ superfamily predicted ATPase
MTTPHQDAATRAAEAIRKAFSIVRLDEDPVHPEETMFHVPKTEEIASILRPFMERNPMDWADIIQENRRLREFSKRKDEEITALKAELKRARFDQMCEAEESEQKAEIMNREPMNPPDDGKTLERGRT